MSNQRSNAWKFWLGLAAGAAAGYYLNSDEGRAARRQAANKANEYGSQIQEQAQITYRQAADGVNTAMEKGKVQAGRLQEQAKTTIDQVSSSLKSTVNATANTIRNNARNAQNHVEEITS